MDFVEISSTKTLWGLIKGKIEKAENRLNIANLSETERLQTLGEHKALTGLLFDWLGASEKAMNGSIPEKEKL